MIYRALYNHLYMPCPFPYSWYSPIETKFVFIYEYFNLLVPFLDPVQLLSSATVTWHRADSPVTNLTLTPAPSACATRRTHKSDLNIHKTTVNGHFYRNNCIFSPFCQRKFWLRFILESTVPGLVWSGMVWAGVSCDTHTCRISLRGGGGSARGPWAKRAFWQLHKLTTRGIELESIRQRLLIVHTHEINK